VAIEKMKRVTALLPADVLPRFTEHLHRSRVLHLVSIEEQLPESYLSLEPASADAPEKAGKLEQVMSFCESWGAGKRSFLESIFPAKTCAREEQILQAANRIDVNSLHAQASELRSSRDKLLQKITSLEKESERLLVFKSLEVPPTWFSRLKYLKVMLAQVPRPIMEGLQQSSPDSLLCETLAGELTWLAWPQWDAAVAQMISTLGITAEELPGLDITAGERLAQISEEKEKLNAQLEGIETESRNFAQRAVEIELALGFWQSEVNRIEGLRKMLRSARIGVVRGYLPARELERFSSDVRSSFAGEIIAEQPQPGEPVPVKIALHPFFRPIRLLVDMFGVPDYFSIDPTPFLTLTFLAFFGICFGDAVYGMMLIAVALLLRRKFRNQEGLRAFFTLFLYCGVSTVIFGALTGSWLGDLSDPKYLGENNLLLRIKNLFPYFDPLANPMTALVIAIGIGIANQFYGILMLIWRNLRRKDIIGALFDGFLWYFYLGGLVILVSGMFTPVPATLSRIAVYILAAGALGLVLTQGRDQPTMPGKIAQGVISLYGIMGSYGATSFIGDALSYSRLLALGLTTTIIGMAFNIIGSILGAMPYIGVLLFIGVAAFGHIFNFLMSIIGSFVHPTRLILLEFFGRFYEAGGIRFQPFGFRTERIEVIRDGGR
jgi:V/A-type H+-transporting ATPase subunit I